MLRIAELPGDVSQIQIGLRKIIERQITTNPILDLLERFSFRFQPPMHRPRMKVKFGGDLFVAAKFSPDKPQDYATHLSVHGRAYVSEFRIDE